jgi:hypothetical protein
MTPDPCPCRLDHPALPGDRPRPANAFATFSAPIDRFTAGYGPAKASHLSVVLSTEEHPANQHGRRSDRGEGA